MSYFRLLTVSLGVHTADYIHHSTVTDSGQSDSELVYTSSL